MSVTNGCDGDANTCCETGCCGKSNCSTCNGVKLSDGSQTSFLASSDLFPVVRGQSGATQNITVTFETLRQSLKFTVESDLDDIPNGSYPVIENGEFVPGSISEESDAVVFGKDIVVPESSVQWGDSVSVSNFGGQIGQTSGGNDFYIPRYQVDSFGSSAPVYYDLGVQSLENIQTTNTTSIDAATIQWIASFGTPGDAWRFITLRVEGNKTTTGVRLVISEDGVPGADNIVFKSHEDADWNNGSGYTILPGLNGLDTRGVTLEVDRTYYFTFEVPVSAGTTIGLQGDGSNVPFQQSDAQTGPVTVLSTGGGTASWGSITGTLSDQTDLQNELNLKLSLSGGTMTGTLNMGGQSITNGNNVSAASGSFTGVLATAVSCTTVNASNYVGLPAIQFVDILTGASFANQNPSGTDTPLQIEFGGAQSTTEMDLSAAGLFTCNVTGQYQFGIVVHYGRTGGAGVSQLFFRVLVNGTQVGRTIGAELDGANDDVPFFVTVPATLNATDTVAFEIVRDSSGNNSGGLLPKTVTVGWFDQPSASVTVRQIQ